MSQKAVEVDELNDQLTEERKRSRDLQWAVEKERCRTGRDEDRKREELEVSFGFFLLLLPASKIQIVVKLSHIVTASPAERESYSFQV